MFRNFIITSVKGFYYNTIRNKFTGPRARICRKINQALKFKICDPKSVASLCIHSKTPYRTILYNYKYSWVEFMTECNCGPS